MISLKSSRDEINFMYLSQTESHQQHQSFDIHQFDSNYLIK